MTFDSQQPDEATRTALGRIADEYGTPAYAFDLRRLRGQAARLREHLPSSMELLYSLKANASLGICDVLAEWGLGADVASAGELATALEAGVSGERIFVAGPFKSQETLELLRDRPEVVVSVDSPSELEYLTAAGLQNAVVLRLRPDFGSCAVVPAGCESRFGFTEQDLAHLADRRVAVGHDALLVGFHVFAGSQVLETDELIGHLTRSLDLSLRAAETLGIKPSYLNLGGGFGIPYSDDQAEIDLVRVGAALDEMVDRAAPSILVLELGRYLVAQAGWYLTRVLGHQTWQGRPAVIVDGGVHQRADICGLRLRTHARPPVVLGKAGTSLKKSPTVVLGALSLPDDILSEQALLPDISPGTVLAFANAGAYGLWSSPALFHGSPLPAEVAFDGTMLHPMRLRQPPQSILADQRHVIAKEEPVQ